MSVLELRDDLHARERRLPFTLGVKGRRADQAVCTGLDFQIAESVVAFDVKGDVLGVAELAGVMGGKRTSDLIPLCHPLPLTDLVVSVTPDRTAGGLRIRAEAATTGPTGVEMEALTAVSVAALTVYDMVKGVERDVEIRAIHLVSKSGGKSGDWRRPPAAAGRDEDDGGARRVGGRGAGRIVGRRKGGR